MVNRQGRPISETLSGRPWYALRPERYPVLLTKAIHDTHLHRYSDPPVAADQRLYGVVARDGGDPRLVAAGLNSSLVALSAEVVGRTALGEGALDLPVSTVRKRLLVPDFEAVTPRHRRRIEQAFEALAHRPVGPIWDELGRPDRQRFDRALLEAFGLDPALLPAIHRGLERLVRQRLELARQRRLGAASCCSTRSR
jgi:hypothetical protein